MSVMIDGQKYTGLTPEADPFHVVLSDGSTAWITQHTITVNGETAQLPEPGNLTPEGTVLSVNGWEVTVAEAEHSNAYFDPSAHPGLDLYTFFNNAISKVSATTDSAVDGLSKIAGTLMGDALSVSAAELAGTPGVALDGFDLSSPAARAAFASGAGALDDFIDSVEMMDLSLNMVNTDLSNGVLDPRIAEMGRVFNSISGRPTKIQIIRNEFINMRQAAGTFASDGAKLGKDILSKLITALRGKYKAGVLFSSPVFTAWIIDLYMVRDTFPPVPAPGNSTGNSTEPAKKPFKDTEWKWFAQTDMPIPLFHMFTKMLDGGEGIKSNAVLGVHTTGPTYYTTMNDSFAIILKHFPLIAYMDRMKTWEEQIEYDDKYFWLDTPFDPNSGDGPPPSAKYQQRESVPLNLQPRALIESDRRESYKHQMMVSWQKKYTYDMGDPDEPTYLRDESEGDGATIFVIDSGIDISVPKLQTEFRTAGKNPDDWIYNMGNAITLPDPALRPIGWTACPEDTQDSHHNIWDNHHQAAKGHGTPVAAIAAGTNFGIAPKADIYSIKLMQCGWRLDAAGDREIRTMGITPRALREATDRVERIVKQRNLQGKAVMNLSWGAKTARFQRQVTPRTINTNDVEDMWERLMKMSAANGIIMVTAAGNDGNWPPTHPGDNMNRVFIGEEFPGRYSRPDNELIVVGGTSWQGRLWTRTSQPGFVMTGRRGQEVVIQDQNDPRLGPDHLVGNIDIYATADFVESPMAGSGVRTMNQGTSFACPQVAGLIAYLLMKPDTRQDWVWDVQRNQQKLWGTRMKELLRDLSWSHVRDADMIPLQSRPWPQEWKMPKVNIAYNGVHGPQEHLPWPDTSTASSSSSSAQPTPAPLSSAPGSQSSPNPTPGSSTPTGSTTPTATGGRTATPTTFWSTSTRSTVSSTSTSSTASSASTSTAASSTSTSSTSSSTSTSSTASSTSTRSSTSFTTVAPWTTLSVTFASLTYPVGWTTTTTPSTTTPSTTTPSTTTPSTTTAATVTPVPKYVLSYDFFWVWQAWGDGTQLCWWTGVSADSRVNPEGIEPGRSRCDIRRPNWDYTTPDAGPICDINLSDNITEKWYNTDGWGQCYYERISENDGGVVGQLTQCDHRPESSPGNISCKVSGKLAGLCDELPYGRSTLAYPVVRCEMEYY
ncbi:hypothetical protein QBC39DRAFT_379284 [Podospora conica]|nr:hypothetical protein QBC39DRAFT_379284 [Schizothecium conicum]